MAPPSDSTPGASAGLFELVPLQALCGMAGPIEVEELRRRTFERGEHARLTADLDARQTTVLDESFDQTLEVIGAVVDAGCALAVRGQPREQLAQQRLEAGRQVVGVPGSFGFVVAIMLHSYLLAPWATACVLRFLGSLNCLITLVSGFR